MIEAFMNHSKKKNPSIFFIYFVTCIFIYCVISIIIYRLTVQIRYIQNIFLIISCSFFLSIFFCIFDFENTMSLNHFKKKK